MSKSKTPKDVDEHICAAPEPTHAKLTQLRKIIKTTGPQAEEVISYHMPYYKQHGHLVGFAAYKDHVSLFGAFLKQLEPELKPYKTGRGSVQFPLDKPLPRALIVRIVKARVRANEQEPQCISQSLEGEL